MEAELQQIVPFQSYPETIFFPSISEEIVENLIETISEL